jgi:murein DD-endopeptidase MepM/ murein hydrolase activator NlpD
MEEEDFYQMLRELILQDLKSSKAKPINSSANIKNAPLVTYNGGYGGYNITLSRGWQQPPSNPDQHDGFDVRVPSGTPIQFLRSGTVTARKDEPLGYGWYLLIKIDGTNDTIMLAHLSAINVNEGDQISPNTIVGATGGIKNATGAGNSDGEHLHYEYRKNGIAVDPSITPPAKPINSVIKLLKP